MKIAILSRSSEIYSTARLLESAKKLNHTPVLLNPRRCYLNIVNHVPEVHYNKKKITDVDVVIPRIAASITEYGTDVVRQFEQDKSITIINNSIGILTSRNKFKCFQKLSMKGIPMPLTCYADAPGDTDDLLKLFNDKPVVIKLLTGTQGNGVIVSKDYMSTKSTIDSFRTLKVSFLVQEFIEEANGSDIRCFVIGNKVVASMKRIGKPGEFRSNVHQGGTVEKVTLTEEEKKIAIRATRIVGLKLAGIDTIRTKNGPMLIEVNSSPGLEGIEQATGKDIASEIIKYAERSHNKKV
jgi:ribosomal protein S6--L-glutamate ligase